MKPRSALRVAALALATLPACDSDPVKSEVDLSPRIMLSAPAPGTSLRDDTVRVTGTARDSSGAVTVLAYTVGSGPEREVAITSAAEVPFAFTVTDLPAGSSTITVYAGDARGNRGAATVSLTYQPNRPPVAVDDSAATTADSAVVVPVLANDSDADGDSLRVALVTAPTLGTAAVEPDGSIRYTPVAERGGTDSLRYSVADSRGAADTATVTVSVRGLNRPPVAADDTASTWTDTAVVVRVLANDSDPDEDPLRVTIVTPPSSGTAAVEADGSIRYTPDPARSGTVSPRYSVEDGRGGADTAAVTISVRALPGPYRVTEIPRLSETNATPIDLNDSGRVLVAGPTISSGYWVSALWDGGQSFTDVRSVYMNGGSSSNAESALIAINDVGQVLHSNCTYHFKSCKEFGFAVSGSPLTILHDYRVSPPGIRSGRLNNVGQVILGDGLWEGGARVALPEANGRPWRPVALSDRGNVVGTTTGTQGSPLAVLYRNGKVTAIVVADTTIALDVNDAGQVVGIARDAGGARFVFLWAEGSFQRLQGMGAAGIRTGRVNNRGEVLSATYAPLAPYLWVRGRSFPLATLTGDGRWEVLSAFELNDVGQIVGYGRNRSTGSTSMILLTPER